AYLGKEGSAADIPAEYQGDCEAAQVALTEAAAESDDDLIMKYLEGEQLTADEVRHGLHLGVKNGTITPVYVATTVGDIGLDRVLQALVRYVPAPSERTVLATVSGNETELPCDPNGPVAAVVFKTIID